MENVGSLSLPSELLVPDYFWRRKRKEAVKIVRRNSDRIFSGSNGQCKVLDVGSCRGLDLFLLHENLKTHLKAKISWIGIDGDPEAINAGNQTAKQKYPDADIRFMFHDITSNFPFQDQEVDFIYCSEVVEHLISPESLFEEFRRILKKDSYFLLTTMNQPNVFELEYWRHFSHKNNNGHAPKEPPQPIETHEVEGRTIHVYDHISLRTIQQWDDCLKTLGFDLVDFGRGASRYALPGSLNVNPVAQNAYFLFDSILDIFPQKLTRNLSCQIIGLYQLKKNGAKS